MNNDRILINKLKSFENINSNLLKHYISSFWNTFISYIFKSSSSFLASSNDNANICNFFNWYDIWC